MLARPFAINRAAFGCLRAATNGAASRAARNGFLGKVPNTTGVCAMHAKIYGRDHKDEGTTYVTDFNEGADHTGRQQNHIWTKEEIDAELKSLYRHKPENITDTIVNKIVSREYLLQNEYNKLHILLVSIDVWSVPHLQLYHRLQGR
jgi:hypothetical protein